MLFVHGAKFTKALVESGLVPNNCRDITIHVGAGDVVEIAYRTYADYSKLQEFMRLYLESVGDRGPT